MAAVGGSFSRPSWRFTVAWVLLAAGNASALTPASLSISAIFREAVPLSARLATCTSRNGGMPFPDDTQAIGDAAVHISGSLVKARSSF